MDFESFLFNCFDDSIILQDGEEEVYNGSVSLVPFWIIYKYKGCQVTFSEKKDKKWIVKITNSCSCHH